MSISVPEEGGHMQKGDRSKLLDQLQETLKAVQSARRHLPFLFVPDTYLFRAEEVLQEVLEKLRKA